MEMLLLEDMNFSASSLISGFIFGVIGWYVFKHGRKNSNNYFVTIGIVLMVYPYFTRGPVADWGVGAALCGLAYHFKDH